MVLDSKIKPNMQNYFLSSADLHSLPEDELKNRFTEYVQNSQTYIDLKSKYTDIKKENEKNYDDARAKDVKSQKIDINTEIKLEQLYINRIKNAETSLRELESEKDKAVEDALAWAKKLIEYKREANELIGYAAEGDIGQIKERFFADACAENIRHPESLLSEIEEEVARIDYGIDRDVKAYLSQLKEKIANGEGPGSNSIGRIHENRSDINSIIEKLKSKRKLYEGYAKTEIDKDFKKYSEEHKKAEEDYKKISEELYAIFGTEDTILTSEFSDLVCEYGVSSLLGDNNAVKEMEGKNTAYGKIYGAIVKKEAGEKRVLRNNTIVSLSAVYDEIAEKTESGAMRKSEAVKALEGVKEALEPVKRRVSRALGDNLVSIYRNVLANSEFDKTELTNFEEFNYMILGGDTLKDEWSDNPEGLHAETGLLRYFEDYVGESEEVEEKTGFGEKMVGKAKNIGRGILSYLGFKGHEQVPVPETKKMIKRNPKINIARLEREIVRKHKHATYRDLDDIFEENLIAIDEVVQLAFGRAVRKNSKNEITKSAKAILELGEVSSITEIFDAYMGAAKVGGGINRDAESLTEIIDGKFYEMDNYINKKAGFSYYAKDRIVDWVNGLFGKAGVEEDMTPKSLAEWSIHDTAIKPNKYAPAIVAFAGLAALVGGYALFYNKITGETVDPKKSTVFSLYEIAKEALIAFGAAKFVKGPEAPKAEAAQVKKK